MLDPVLLAVEPELNATRWHAHQGAPLTLNRQYAVAYKSVFKEMFRDHVDAKGARNVRGLNLNIFVGAPDKNGTMRALHVARQEADRHGLPYETFIRHAFGFRMSRKPVWLPRPNVLIPIIESTKKLEPDEFLMRDRIVEGYHNSLLNLTEEFATQNPGMIGIGKIPSCVGVVGSRSDTSPACSACPFFDRCKDMGDKIATLSVKSGLVAWADQKINKRRKIESDKNRRRRRLKMAAFDPIADAKKMADQLRRKRSKSAARSKKYRAAKTVPKLSSTDGHINLTPAEMDELLKDLDL